MIVYYNGRFIPKQEVAISPDDRGFLFADGVYEVVRAYEGRLFESEAHMARLARSLAALRIQGPEPKRLIPVAQRLLAENDLETGQATVYIQITRGAAPRKHYFPETETPPTVYAAPARFEPDPEKAENGVRVILVPDTRWTRCDIKSVALLPNVLASQQAMEQGAEEALFVRDGMVIEGSHTNFCAVFDGELVIAPNSNYTLAGITRKVVLELCRELDIPVRCFPIAQSELFDRHRRPSGPPDEFMILGTTKELMPVVRINERMVGDGVPGPTTRRLQEAFRQRTHRS